jgi:hypothetical protein
MMSLKQLTSLFRILTLVMNRLLNKQWNIFIKSNFLPSSSFFYPISSFSLLWVAGTKVMVNIQESIWWSLVYYGFHSNFAMHTMFHSRASMDKLVFHNWLSYFTSCVSSLILNSAFCFHLAFSIMKIILLELVVFELRWLSERIRDNWVYTVGYHGIFGCLHSPIEFICWLLWLMG